MHFSKFNPLAKLDRNQATLPPLALPPLPHEDMTSNWANTQHIQLATAGYYIPEQPPSDYSSSYDDHFLPHSNTIPSRTLNHPLTNTPVGDKGLVAIAKPFTTDSHQLAIAGRTCWSLLHFPLLI